MNPVFDLKEKNEARRRVKDENNGKVITNFYDFTVDKNCMFFPGSLIHERIGESEIFLYKEKRSFRLFYYSPSIEKLENDLKKISFPTNFSVILEITERTEISPLKDRTPILSLHKMSKPLESFFYKFDLSNGDIKNALPQELKCIENILLSNFDPILERVPDLSELAKIHSKQGIKVFKIRNEIKGLIVFNEDNKKLHLRYIWVDSKYRNQGIARNLMNEFFQYSVANAITFNFLWVGLKNTRAQEFYKKLGFQEDPLFDHIYYL